MKVHLPHSGFLVIAMKNSIKSILVSSDGDYVPLVKFWQHRDQLQVILSPSSTEKCSVLLKRTEAKIVYLKDKRNVLEYKNEKAPGGDELCKGPFRGEH